MLSNPPSPAWLDGIDAVLLSPGIPPTAPGIAELLAAADDRAIAVASELDLFADALADLVPTVGYHPEVVAITGTNGKTTTTVLSAALLTAAGRSAVAAGNIGPALMDTLATASDAGTLPDVWVLELSSFQLTYGRGFAPTVGVLLNVTPDHLDWHGTFDDYARAKFRVLAARHVIACRDDEVVRSAVAAIDDVGLSLCTVGVGQPPSPGDLGVVEVAGVRHLGRHRPGPGAEPLMPVDDLRIRGDHATIDALAALAVVDHLAVISPSVLSTLAHYPGEAHRTQVVATVDGVDYIDDGKATNVAATCAALASCGADRRLIVILGGESKGQSFRGLRRAVQASARHALTMGRAAPLIERDLRGVDVPVERATSLPRAIRRARDLAHPGDAVLLSPACASTDAFTNYVERSRCFQATVAAFAEEVGDGVTTSATGGQQSP